MDNRIQYWHSSDTGVYQVVRPGNVSPTRFIPPEIGKPPYFYTDDIPDLFTSYKTEIKLPKAVESMRDSCRLAANILDKCGEILKVGMKMDFVLKIYKHLVNWKIFYHSPARSNNRPNRRVCAWRDFSIECVSFTISLLRIPKKCVYICE